jgi:hypothetical protein
MDQGKINLLIEWFINKWLALVYFIGGSLLSYFAIAFWLHRDFELRIEYVVLFVVGAYWLIISFQKLRQS